MSSYRYQSLLLGFYSRWPFGEYKDTYLEMFYFLNLLNVLVINGSKRDLDN